MHSLQLELVEAIRRSSWEGGRNLRNLMKISGGRESIGSRRVGEVDEVTSGFILKIMADPLA